MNQASEALIRGDIQRMKQLLDQQVPASPETDQRDFEWYLLWKAGHLSKNWTGPRLLGSGSGAIFYDLAVSPDGKIVAATDRIDATLYVFESETLHLLCSPLIIGTPFDRLCFSSDGRHLIAADAMGDALRIFDTKTWAHVKTLSGGRTRAVDCARTTAADGYGPVERDHVVGYHDPGPYLLRCQQETRSRATWR